MQPEKGGLVVMRLKLRTGILAVLTTLFVPLSRVSDLTGIGECKYLEKIRLDFGSISNLAPLAKLTNLQSLRLIKHKITDISPLAKLTNLRSLALSYNKITDITPLKELRKLEWLRLEENNISDLQPLIGNSNPKKENNNNKGLGKGDKIFIHQNQLNLTEGSEDLQGIQTLIDRGVEVKFHPQKQGESS